MDRASASSDHHFLIGIQRSSKNLDHNSTSSVKEHDVEPPKHSRISHDVDSLDSELECNKSNFPGVVLKRRKHESTTLVVDEDELSSNETTVLQY